MKISQGTNGNKASGKPSKKDIKKDIASEIEKVEVAFTTKKGKTVKFCKPKSKGPPASPTGEDVRCPVCKDVHPILSFKGVGHATIRTWECPKVGCMVVMRGKKAQQVIKDEWLVKGAGNKPPDDSSAKKSIKLAPVAEAPELPEVNFTEFPKKEPAKTLASHVRESTTSLPADAKKESQVREKKKTPPDETWEIDDELLKKLGM